MELFLCEVCGHIEMNSAPENCPVCQESNFAQNNNIFKESEASSPEASVKHTPRVTVNKTQSMFEDKDDCVEVSVRVGEVVHPSDEKHFIQFVDIYVDEKYATRAQFTPGAYPAAVAYVKAGSKISVVENCNLHGWWMKEINL